MGRKDALQVAAAGEHYTAFRLAQLGYVVALPRGGSPAVDLLVSNAEGTKTVAIQVKTTEWALRQRGRGDSKADHHLEFPLGAKAARESNDRFVYVFVDLRGRSPSSIPQAYIVPSKDVVAYCGKWAAEASLVRWHRSMAEVSAYMESWSTITSLLE